MPEPYPRPAGNRAGIPADHLDVRADGTVMPSLQPSIGGDAVPAPGSGN